MGNESHTAHTFSDLLSDALDARGVMDLAQVALVRSRYQERTALANLELAMGLTQIPEMATGNESETQP